MPPSPPKSSGNPSAAEGVAWRLSQLLRNPANQTVGRVHLVALDPARQHFGPEWPRVSEKVYDIVEGIFRESLITGEIYSRIDAMSYAIIPADKDENFSELIEAISEKIFTRVMGAGAGPKKLFLASLMVTISDDTPIGGPLRLRARPAAGTPPSLEVGHIERLLDEAARHEVKFSLDDIRFALSPMFSTEQLAISSFFCRSFYPDGPGRFRHGYDALPADADVPVIAELDALTAEYAAKKLTAMGAGRAQNLIYIPVHRLTLSSRKYRDIYLKICQGLLHHHKDSVVFDIHGIEDGTPPNRTAEYLQWLRPHAKAVAATVPIDFTTTASFTGSAIQSIGVDLAAGEADAIEPKIVRFIGRVKATGNRCHIHGANTKPLADLCLRLAADTIDGDQDADT